MPINHSCVAGQQGLPGRLACVLSPAPNADIGPVLIPQRLWNRLFHYAKSVETEISGFGTVVLTGGGLRVTDLFLLPQAARSNSVVIEAETIGKFLYAFMQQGGDPEELRLHWHSHGRFSVAWSQQDERTIKELTGMAGAFVSLVVNRWGDYLCRLDQHNPRPTRRDIPVRLHPDPALPEPAARWTAEVSEKVKERTT